MGSAVLTDTSGVMKSQAFCTQECSTKFTNSLMTVAICTIDWSALNQRLLRGKSRLVEEVVTGKGVMAFSAGKVGFSVFLNALSVTTLRTNYFEIQVCDVTADQAVNFMAFMLIITAKDGMNSGFFLTDSAFCDFNVFLT